MLRRLVAGDSTARWRSMSAQLHSYASVASIANPRPAHQIDGSNVVCSSKDGMPRKGVPEGVREVGVEPDFGTQLELSRRPLGVVRSYFAVS